MTETKDVDVELRGEDIVVTAPGRRLFGDFF